MKRIIVLAALLAACSGSPPDAAQQRVTKFGPDGTSTPSSASAVAKTTELIVQQQVEYYLSTGAGFVEFQPDDGSGWQGMPPAGQLLAGNSGWRFDSTESWYAGASCASGPSSCQWHLDVGHDTTQFANGPSLICSNLINTGTGVQQDWVNVPTDFPSSWSDDGPQWHRWNYSMSWNPLRGGVSNAGKCHWDFDPSHPVVLDLWWTSTFAPNENPEPGSPTSIPPLMWTTVFFHYTTAGVSYEYRAVIPGAFSSIGHGITGG